MKKEIENKHGLICNQQAFGDGTISDVAYLLFSNIKLLKLRWAIGHLDKNASTPCYMDGVPLNTGSSETSASPNLARQVDDLLNFVKRHDLELAFVFMDRDKDAFGRTMNYTSCKKTQTKNPYCRMESFDVDDYCAFQQVNDSLDPDEMEQTSGLISATRNAAAAGEKRTKENYIEITCNLVCS